MDNKSMPAELSLSKKLKKAKWKVKIRERERLEPPHVSIINATNTWRISLRSGDFLDKVPDPDEIPDELLQYIRNGKHNDRQTVWEWLCEKWDDKYPKNKVASAD